MTFRNPTLVAVLAVPFLVTACAPEEAAPATLATREQAFRILNGIKTKDLTANTVVGHERGIRELINTPLNSAAFRVRALTPSYLHVQIDYSSYSQRFMEYLVSCALTANDAVTFQREDLRLPNLKWRGAAGLCRQWAEGLPDEACLERVTGCLLARNNKEGRVVNLSVRGEDWYEARLFETAPTVATQTFVNGVGVDLPEYSQSGCVRADGDASASCGWRPQYVGHCVPDTLVSLGAGANPRGRCGLPVLGSNDGLANQPLLRLCGGVSGCSASEALAPAQPGCGEAPYPTFEFRCPSDGLYSVMSMPSKPDVVSSPPATFEIGSDVGGYPATELEAFSIREGAFYGNLFVPEAVKTNIYIDIKTHEEKNTTPTVQGSVFGNTFACYDRGWDRGQAYLTTRLCALPETSANCAAQVMGACRESTRADPTMLCEQEDGYLVPGDKDYEYCHGRGSDVWTHPVTVVLNKPCDVVGLTGKVCGRVK